MAEKKKKADMIIVRPKRFKDEIFDFQLLRAIQYEIYKGSSAGECYLAANSIKNGDFESWITSWEKLAVKIEKKAEKALFVNARETARDTFMRAYNYYRAAEFFVKPATKRKLDFYKRSTRCFYQASQLFDHPFEKVEIPYEGISLPGYFIRPLDDSMSRPTIIILGGGDASGEETYFMCGGAEAVNRGYNVLIFDGPGQRGMLHRDKDQVFRPDYEKVITPVVDFVIQQKGVDPKKVALYGISLAGNLGARAAAFEHRLSALILNAPMIDFYIWNAEGIKEFAGFLKDEMLEKAMKLLMKMSALLKFAVEQYQWILGNYSRYLDIFERMKDFHLKDTPREIQCPVLCMHGEGETPALYRQTEEFIKMLNVPYEIRKFTEAEGADAHCQMNNLSLSHQVYLDWLAKIWS